MSHCLLIRGWQLAENNPVTKPRSPEESDQDVAASLKSTPSTDPRAGSERGRPFQEGRGSAAVWPTAGGRLSPPCSGSHRGAPSVWRPWEPRASVVTLRGWARTANGHRDTDVGEVSFSTATGRALDPETSPRDSHKRWGALSRPLGAGISVRQWS